MGFEEQYQQARIGSSNFESMYQQAQITSVRPPKAKLKRFIGAPTGMTYPYTPREETSEIQPRRVRPLEKPTEPMQPERVQPVYGFATPSMLKKADVKKGGKLLSRLGKQFYNMAMATPAHELVKADMDAATIRAAELTKQWENEQGTRLSDDLLDEQVEDWANQLRQPSRVRESDYLKKERQFAEEKPDVNPFAAYVSEAQGLSEKAVDIIAGVAGFAAQLAVLRKAFPMAKPAVIWETQNIVTGGKPGAGVAMYGAFTVPGKVLKGTSLIARGHRLAAESINLAALSAYEQKIDTGEIDYMQVGIAAALPAALRTPKAIKKLIRARHPKVLTAIAKTYPEILERQLERYPSQFTSMVKGKWPIPARFGEKDILQVTKTWAKTTKALTKAGRKEALRFAMRQKYISEVKSGTPSKIAEKRAWGEATRLIKSSDIRLRPLVLTKAQKDSFNREILRAYTYEFPTKRAGAIKAMLKMQDGRIPTNYEFGLLAPVLGESTTMKIFNSLQGKIPYEGRDAPRLIRDGLKAMRFGFDPQTTRGLSKTSWRHPINYLKSVGVNVAGIFSRKYSDKIAANIKASRTYTLGKTEYGVNYLDMRPWGSVEAGTKLQQYGDFADLLLRSDDEVIKGIGKWLRASERGANLGINYGMNKLVTHAEKSLDRFRARRAKAGKPLSPDDRSAWRKQRGNIINAFSKRVIAKHPKIQQIQQAANWVVFSPAYAVSGPTADIGSLLRIATGKGPNRHYGMQMILSQIAGLTAVSGTISYMGHKKFINDPSKAPEWDSSPLPTNPLWGKIRQGNDVYDLSFGDVGPYRLLARVGLSAYMYGRELQTGKQITVPPDIRQHPGFPESLKTEYIKSLPLGKKIPTAGEAFHRYLSSKRTLWLGIANQLLTGKDWLGRPTDLKGTGLDNLPFEFLAAFVEAGEADGLWEEMANGIEFDEVKKSLKNLPMSIAALGGIGTMSYPVHAATIRTRFRDVIAQEKYDKDWDKLTTREQSRLKSKHRKQFAVLSDKVRRERIEVPFSEERIQREKTEANRRVSKMLSKENEIIVKDIDLDIGRVVKDFYLSDPRYNRFQELVAQYLNEKLSRIDFTRISDKRRTLRLKGALKMSKSKAWSELRKEIGRKEI